MFVQRWLAVYPNRKGGGCIWHSSYDCCNISLPILLTDIGMTYLWKDSSSESQKHLKIHLFALVYTLHTWLACFLDQSWQPLALWLSACVSFWFVFIGVCNLNNIKRYKNVSNSCTSSFECVCVVNTIIGANLCNTYIVKMTFISIWSYTRLVLFKLSHGAFFYSSVHTSTHHTLLSVGYLNKCSC